MEPIKILIVEDELLTAASMRITLEKAGYKITEAIRSGEDAIKSIKNNLPDIVLMDIHLHGKTDGITTARSIKRLFSLPLIFITQQQDEEIFQNALEVFPKNYITKPFTDSSLVRAVELAIKNTTGETKNTITHTPATIADSVFIATTGGAKVKLLLSDILYIKSNGAYTEIYYECKEKIKNAHHKVTFSSNHVVEQLAYPAIIKANKSYHVNIQKIEKIQGSSIFIQSSEITVAKEYLDELKKKLLFFKH